MEEQRQTIVKKAVKTGISFGSSLAMVISFTTWHSVGWAIVHGLLSWLYVLFTSSAIDMRHAFYRTLVK